MGWACGGCTPRPKANFKHRSRHVNRIEQWRPVPGFGGRYLVSTTGRVVMLGWTQDDGRVRKERELRQHPVPPPCCYHRRVTLRRPDGRRCGTLVHTLVARAFLGPGQPGQVVMHRDEELSPKEVNAVWNLHWGTPQANNQDMRAKGRAVVVRGSRCHFAKLTEDQALCIWQRRSSNAGVCALAEEFGVSIHTVYLIWAGKTWRHATGAGTEKGTTPDRIGAPNHVSTIPTAVRGSVGV